MAKRPNTTLLIVTGRFVARADYGSAPAAARLGFWQGPPAPDDDQVELVRAALALGPPCGKEVWLLTDHVWTQRVYFAAAALAGLDGAQREQAIGFEIESLSGISALQSRLGVQRLGVAGGSEAFWVTQVQNDLISAVAGCIAAAGGRLRGLVHPGGLPVPLVAESGRESFSRIEVWGEATLCLEQVGGPPPQVRVINVGPAQEQWQGSVENWLARVVAPHTEWLSVVDERRRRRPDGSVAGDSLRPVVGRPILEVPALTGPFLGEFLDLWAGELSRPGPRVPVITPPARSTPVGRLAVVSAILLAAALLICAGHGWLLGRELEEVQGRLSDLDRAQQQKTKLTEQIGSFKKQLAQMASVPAGAAEREDEIRRQQERWPAMLSCIAQATGDGVVLDSLTGEAGGAVRVEGVCLRAAAADELAARMSAVLASKGWTVSAAEKWVAETDADESASPLWQYRIVVWPQGKGFATAARTAEAARRPTNEASAHQAGGR